MNLMVVFFFKNEMNKIKNKTRRKLLYDRKNFIFRYCEDVKQKSG